MSNDDAGLVAYILLQQLNFYKVVMDREEITIQERIGYSSDIDRIVKILNNIGAVTNEYISFKPCDVKLDS
jgi:hypothetical protein